MGANTSIVEGDFMKSCHEEESAGRQQQLVRIERYRQQILKDIENLERIRTMISSAMQRNEYKIIYIANILNRGEHPVIHCHGLEGHELIKMMTDNKQGESLEKRLQKVLGKDFEVEWHGGITENERDWDQYEIHWGSGSCTIL